MPAGLPEATLVQNQANPNQGRFVTFDALSGPKNSPFDARKITSWANFMPVYANDPLNVSTGGLSTGIGFGTEKLTSHVNPTAPASIKAAGFTDDYKPGISTPVPADSTNSRFMYIGGGRSLANGTPNPYTAGFGIAGAGNGGSRDAGAGPAFTGFPLKMVTAAADIANGADIEAGWANRSGVTVKNTYSAFGSGGSALATPTLEIEEEEPEEEEPIP